MHYNIGENNTVRGGGQKREKSVARVLGPVGVKKRAEGRGGWKEGRVRGESHIDTQAEDKSRLDTKGKSVVCGCFPNWF